MSYAIIQTGGKQYKVKAGEIIKIEKLDKFKPESKLEFKELPMDDPIQRKPSIELARELLSWEPEIELREGLNKTIEWFKNNI